MVALKFWLQSAITFYLDLCECGNGDICLESQEIQHIPKRINLIGFIFPFSFDLIFNFYFHIQFEEDKIKFANKYYKTRFYIESR